MAGLSEKIYLQLPMPTDEDGRSDQVRITQALEDLGYDHIGFSLSSLRQLYPLCRDADYRITVSLVKRELDYMITGVQAGDTRNAHYGLAVDYGSTTIVMQLVDQLTGKIIAEEKQVNRQVQYGTDILTRITYVMEDPDRRADLHMATVQTFRDLLDALTQKTGIACKDLPAMVISGNTTMIHFLLQLDAWTVFASPYAPVCSAPGFRMGTELGLNFVGVVYLMPAASNYIGGDITSGLLQLQIHNSDKTCLFFDIGTNGELVVGNKEWIVAGAGAAGPALEGYISQFGMRAADGAIDHVKIDKDKLTYTTIGNKPPIGICGSGIIDLLAQMRLNRWIDMAGELNPSASDRIQKIDNQWVAVYATAKDGTPLYFSQSDIAQYLDTKAAAHTMVSCLLDMVGATMDDIDTLYLSGAFPAHSDLESAITIGIFPDIPREKYRCIPNTSLDGARLLLTNREMHQQLTMLSEEMHCVQFASVPDFIIRMQAAKFIPHTDMDLYPTIRDRLKE